jgi:hypothetical protein
MLSGSSVFYTGGNVGIGTASPTQPLSVSGIGSLGKLVISGANSYSGGGAGLDQGDIILGDPNFGSRHDSSILFWTVDSADRLSATGGRFNFDEYSTTGGAGAFITGRVGGDSSFSGNVNSGANNAGKGITLHDDTNGNPYCVHIHSGGLVASAGACQ